MFLRNPSEKQVEALIEWSKNVLGMELDIDKQYRYSVFSTRKRIIYECLVNAANSAIEACRGGKNISSFNCGGLNIDININIDCSSITVPGNTWDVNCEDITVTARYGNTTHTLRDMVCKFGGA